MNKLLIVLSFLIMGFFVSAREKTISAKEKEIDAKVESLLKKMTLKKKLARWLKLTLPLSLSVSIQKASHRGHRQNLTP